MIGMIIWKHLGDAGMLLSFQVALFGAVQEKTIHETSICGSCRLSMLNDSKDWSPAIISETPGIFLAASLFVFDACPPVLRVKLSQLLAV